MSSRRLHNGKPTLKINLEKKSKFYDQTIGENIHQKISICFVLNKVYIDNSQLPIPRNKTGWRNKRI
jgi:hypothetical protein